MIKNDAEQILKHDIKSGQLKSLYLFFGEEDYLKEYYVKQLQSLVSPDKDEFSYAEFENFNFSFERFEEEVSSVPFMSERKLVVVRNLRFSHLRGAKDDFLKLLSQLPDTTVVLLYYDGSVTASADYAQVKKAREEFKKLSAGGLMVELKVRGQAELQRWLARHFAAAKMKYEANVIPFVLAHCSKEMAALKGEVEKLTLYCTGKICTVSDVEKVCSKSEEKELFDLTNDIGAQRYESAFETLEKLKQLKYDPQKIIAGIGQVFCEMLYVKAALDRSITSVETIMRDFGIPAQRKFLLQRYFPVVARLNADYLRNCVKLLAECEAGSRVSDEWIIIERAVAEMMKR